MDVEPRDQTVALLSAVGYYRLTGYLFPFRLSERAADDDGRVSVRVLSHYRPGTTIDHVARLIDFDRRLRVLVMDGVERIEVAVRMRTGYVLGERSPFAHLEADTFLPTFGMHQRDEESGWPTRPSRHAEWLHRVALRRNGSDETFATPTTARCRSGP